MPVVHEFKVRISSDKPSNNPWIIAEQILHALEYWNKENGLSSEADPFIKRGIDVVVLDPVPLFPPKWPFEITDDQKSALFRKWCQNQNELTFQEFVDGITPMLASDGAITVEWCNMWLAIETDGYTHS